MLSNQRTTDETRVCVYALGDSGVEQLDSFSMGRTRLLSGTGNCLYLSTDNELYTYDPTNQNLTLTAKWVNWGVNGAAVVDGQPSPFMEQPEDMGAFSKGNERRCYYPASRGA